MRHCDRALTQLNYDVRRIFATSGIAC